MQNDKEIFPIVDEQGEVVGSASRKECHSGSMLLHPVVHLHVFDKEGRLFLQHRSKFKDIQPDKWDTSVGGHVDYGEPVEKAVRREAREELGLTDVAPRFLYRYVFQSRVERELVNTYYAVCQQSDIRVDKDEVTEGRFFTFDEIRSLLGKNFFTPNFEEEFEKLVKLRIDLNIR